MKVVVEKEERLSEELSINLREQDDIKVPYQNCRLILLLHYKQLVQPFS